MKVPDPLTKQRWQQQTLLQRWTWEQREQDPTHHAMPLVSQQNPRHESVAQVAGSCAQVRRAVPALEPTVMLEPRLAAPASTAHEHRHHLAARQIENFLAPNLQTRKAVSKAPWEGTRPWHPRDCARQGGS